MVRPLRAEVERYGPYYAAESTWDHPAYGDQNVLTIWHVLVDATLKTGKNST